MDSPKRKFLLFFFYLSLLLQKLLKEYDLFRRAYTIVQQRRFCINPNEGFMAQLREYEPIYQAQQTSRHSLLTQRIKRTIHQMDNERTEDKCDKMDS